MLLFYTEKKIECLGTTEDSQDTNLPVKAFKENVDYHVEFFFTDFDDLVICNANITPIFKNQSRNHKNNYKSVSILTILSKIFEKVMNKELSIHFEKILSKFQCGFQKGLSTQQCLVLLIKKWKKCS